MEKMLHEENGKTPKRVLNMVDAIALIVGIVIGAGIFRTPSMVAGNVETGGMLCLAWLLGGIVSLIGALCYAELTTAFPNTGGDYHFLMRAFGKRIAFLFAWARMSVIQTGSIALLAFIAGDYASQIYSLGEFSPVIYAAIIVVLLTFINIIGIRVGARAQKLLTTLEVSGILGVIIAGFFFLPETAEVSFIAGNDSGAGNALGLAMIFVLLTYGGWNEAAYISAEIRSGNKPMVRALVFSILIITSIYLLVNIALLKGLGLSGTIKCCNGRFDEPFFWPFGIDADLDFGVGNSHNFSQCHHFYRGPFQFCLRPGFSGFCIFG